MKQFNDRNFVLQSPTAERLYHDYAAHQPIIDYHCHLSPAEVAADRNFETITNLWLDGDHYKWRAMRTNGIDEKYITGGASPRERFEKWAETVPYTMRNPLYHWAHLELKSAFGVEELLSPATSQKIYDHCNELSHRATTRLASLCSTTESRRFVPPTTPVTLSSTTQLAARMVSRVRCCQLGVPTRVWQLTTPLYIRRISHS